MKTICAQLPLPCQPFTDDAHSLRHELIIKERLNGKTYREIGEILGISRQRVEAIASPPMKTLQDLMKRAEGKCQTCGRVIGRSGHAHHNGDQEETYQDISQLQYLCISCHLKAHGNPSHHPCKQCGKTLRSHHGPYPIFCSRQCRQDYIVAQYPQLRCEHCGKTFKRAPKFVRSATRRGYRHIWCSKQCQGQWFAKTHGFLAHPENITARARP